MTREEAIKKINAIKKYLITGNPIWDVKEIDEVLNMAIEALEQEPVVRCKDCIHGEEMKKTWADRLCSAGSMEKNDLLQATGIARTEKGQRNEQHDIVGDRLRSDILHAVGDHGHRSGDDTEMEL